MPYSDRNLAIEKSRRYYYAFKDRILEERSRRQMMRAAASQKATKSCLSLLQDAERNHKAEHDKGEKVDGNIHRTEEDDSLRVGGDERLHDKQGQGEEKEIPRQTQSKGGLEQS